MRGVFDATIPLEQCFRSDSTAAWQVWWWQLTEALGVSAWCYAGVAEFPGSATL